MLVGCVDLTGLTASAPGQREPERQFRSVPYLGKLANTGKSYKLEMSSNLSFGPMRETRKIVAILFADMVDYSQLSGFDEIRTLSRLRGVHSDLIDPALAAHQGRLVKRTGDGILAEFRSVLDATRCAIEVQEGLSERNIGLSEDRRIDFRIGIHVGEVVEEEDGDLMGDGVNIAARLEGQSKAGAICISAAAYDQVRDKLSLNATSLGEVQLKNISRPIHVYQILPDADSSVPHRVSRHPTLPNKPSIAVLPFENISDDTRQDYFADGIVEDIITGLSRIKWLFVIARNSSYVYKSRATDIRQVGLELGVRYVLEGSVRRGGDKLRVTAQLIDTATGAHLWADRYDGTLENVFDFQDSITERVVGIVEPSVRKVEVERSRRKRPESLDAYDLFLRAMPDLQSRMPEGGRAAIPLLEKALQLEPGYPAAHAHLAWCHEWCFTRGGLDEKHRTAALQHARAAIVSGTDDAATLSISGWVIIVLTKERETATAALERALALNPSCATAHYFAALVHAWAGRSVEAATHSRQALRLSPFDPSNFEAHLALGIAATVENKFDDAITCFAAASRVNPKHSLFPFLHAIALALAGRPEEAEDLITHGLSLEPGFRLQVFNEFGMAPSLAGKLIEGGRRLRLPE